MSNWKPESRHEVEQLFTQELALLHASHRAHFNSILVPIRSVPISSAPGESVYVVAEHNGRLLYWSDIEAGWEVESPDKNGGIGKRGSNQFELCHIAHQLFGEPNAT
jgi:hypothetical protein